jgi:hypothetical protein
MTRKTAYARTYNQDSFESNKTLWEYAEIWRQVEHEINKFVESEAIKCQIAKEQGWLGTLTPRCSRGFLGYLRTGFALQFKILYKFENPLPIYQSEFVDFFRSDFFRNEVLKNNYIKPFYKKEHIEIIKQLKL